MWWKRSWCVAGPVLLCALVPLLWWGGMRFAREQVRLEGMRDADRVAAMVEAGASAAELDALGLQLCLIDDAYHVGYSSLHGQMIESTFFTRAIYAYERGRQVVVLPKSARGGPAFFFSRAVPAGGSAWFVCLLYPVPAWRWWRNLCVIVFLLLLCLLAVSLAAWYRAAVDASMRPFLDFFSFMLHTDPRTGLVSGRMRTDFADPGMQDIARRLNAVLDHYQLAVSYDQKQGSVVSSFLQSSLLGVVFVDLEGKVTLANKAAGRMLGFSRHSLFIEHVRNGALEQVVTMAGKAREKRESLREFLPVQGRIIEVDVRPLANKYEPFAFMGMFVLLRDVTKDKEMEQEQIDFVSNASHELRTPMTVISGLVQALATQGGTMDAAQRAYCFDLIDQEIKKMETLVSSLLSLSSVEHAVPDRLSLVPVDAVVARTVDRMRVAAEEKSITLRTTTDGKAVVRGKAEWVEQILTNLVDNAVKYSPEGSVVEVRLAAGGGTVSVEVEDHGVGISPEDLPHVFDRFFRADKSRSRKVQGYGLGLALAKKLAGLMQGTLVVRSTPGKGSVFTVSFPVAKVI